jgi:hypothetical protein
MGRGRGPMIERIRVPSYRPDQEPKDMEWLQAFGDRG